MNKVDLTDLGPQSVPEATAEGAAADRDDEESKIIETNGEGQAAAAREGEIKKSEDKAAVADDASGGQDCFAQVQFRSQRLDVKSRKGLCLAVKRAHN